MGDVVEDLLVTPLSADAASLAAAERDLTTLAGYTDWDWEARKDLPLLRRLGEHLFGLAFGDAHAQQNLLKALGIGLLRLTIATEDGRLARLPWEFMAMPETLLAAAGRTLEDLGWPPEGPPFLALHPQVSVVRRGAGGRRAKLVEGVGPLRLLIAWASPACGDWPRIETIDAELEGISGELRGLTASHVEIRVLAKATRAGLARQLKTFRPHLLHVLAHGAFPRAADDLGEWLSDDPGDVTAPSVVLHGPRGGYRYLTAAILAGLCQRYGVRVVVLNSCWSGQGRQGVAAALSAAGVPLVVGMQVRVLQTVAYWLAKFFYRNGLAMGHSLEDSLADYRRACASGWASGLGAPDWGIPVLYLGVDDSTLIRTTTADPYPIDFRPLLGRHAPIVGRGFLFERIAAWRKSTRTGVFLLTAAPGIGKTAFASQYVQTHPPGAHYFFVQREGRSDPHDCLRSLYIALLGRYGELDPEARALRPRELREKLAAFLAQTVAPRCAAQDRDEVIVIDALDESGTSDGQDIAELLPADLPPRIYLLLTSRPGPLAERLTRRGDIERFHLKGELEDNLADAAEYCRLRLEGQLPPPDRPPIPGAAWRLAKRAGGNFLVLHHFLNPKDVAEAGSLAAIEARPLTPHVQDIYKDFLTRIMDRYRDNVTARKTLVTILGALVTAAAPVAREQVSAAFALDAEDWRWALEHLAQFLSQGGVREAPAGVDTYGLYHETFREFLLDHLAPDLPALHGHWAAYARTWAELQGYARCYALRYLPSHERQAREGEALAETLLDYGYLAAALGADGNSSGHPPRSPFDLVADFGAARGPAPAEAREAVRLVGGALDLCTHTVAAAPEELPGQLSGRLLRVDDPRVRQVLARVSCPGPWLRPISPTLTAPGGPLLRVLEGHTDWVNHVALVGDGRAVSASADRTLRVWDLASGECRRVLEGHAKVVTQVALTGDGRAVSVSEDRTVRVWDLDSGDCLRVLEGHAGRVGHVAVMGDGRAVSASDDGTLRVWDLESGACLRVLGGYSGRAGPVALTGDGRVVSASADGTLRIWGLDSGICLGVLSGHADEVNHLALTEDGRVVSASSDGTLGVWGLDSGVCLGVLAEHIGPVWHVALTPDGRVVSASADGTLRVWDLDAGTCLRVLTRHTDEVDYVALTGDGRAVSASADRTLRVWDLASGASTRVLTGHTDSVNQVALTGDGRAVSVSEDRTVRVWDLDSDAYPPVVEGHTDRVNHVALTRDGRVVSASCDGTLRVWDLASSVCLRVLKGHTDRVNHVALSGGGQAVSASADHTLRVWDIDSGACVSVLVGHTDEVNHVALTRDGWAVSAADDGTLRVWELGIGACTRVLCGHAGRIGHVALTGDGRAVSASVDRTLRVWDLGTGVCLGALEGHTYEVSHVALTGGGRAVSASVDRTLRVWDLGTGACLRVLAGHRDRVQNVAVSHDGRAVSASADRTLRVWDLATGTCRRVLRCHSGAVRQSDLTAEARAVSASEDRTLRLWDLATGVCLTRFTGEAPMACCAVTLNGRMLVAGDAVGALHVLHIEDGGV